MPKYKHTLLSRSSKGENPGYLVNKVVAATVKAKFVVKAFIFVFMTTAVLIVSLEQTVSNANAVPISGIAKH